MASKLHLENGTFTVVPPRRRRRQGNFTLKLTSMIDMFTILLVFLLNSYSAEGEIMTVAKDITLPKSTAEKPPESTPIVMVTGQWLILDGQPLVPVAEILRSRRLLIPELKRQLERTRQATEQLAALNPTLDFRGEITIQGDREIPFELLKKVMFTCGQVGYNNLLLAVTQESS
jgi:biopolymer transport protein ExbD